MFKVCWNFTLVLSGVYVWPAQTGSCCTSSTCASSSFPSPTWPFCRERSETWWGIWPLLCRWPPVLDRVSQWGRNKTERLDNSDSCHSLSCEHSHCRLSRRWPHGVNGWTGQSLRSCTFSVGVGTETKHNQISQIQKVRLKQSTSRDGSDHGDSCSSSHRQHFD